MNTHSVKYRKVLGGIYLSCLVVALASLYLFPSLVSKISYVPLWLRIIIFLLNVVCFGFAAALVYPFCLRVINRPIPIICLFGAFVLILSGDLFFINNYPKWGSPIPQFHPWASYDKRNTYLYSHAKEKWVTDFHGVSFLQKKPAGVTRIILSGASTMWGYTLSDDESPAGYLNRLLKERYPNQKFEVITIALPGKYQLNELIDAAVTLPHWSPDLVISWNGWNELIYGEQDRFYEGMPYITGELETITHTSPWFAIFTNTFAGRMLFQVRRNRFQLPYQLKDEEPSATPRFFDYLARTARTLKSDGIRYVFSFTPNRLEMGARSLAESQHFRKDLTPRDIKERRSLASQIVREQGQQSYNVMESLSDAAFIDDCHLSSKAVGLAMTEIANQLPFWLGKRGMVGAWMF